MARLVSFLLRFVVWTALSVGVVHCSTHITRGYVICLAFLLTCSITPPAHLITPLPAHTRVAGDPRGHLALGTWPPAAIVVGPSAGDSAVSCCLLLVLSSPRLLASVVSLARHLLAHGVRPLPSSTPLPPPFSLPPRTTHASGRRPGFVTAGQNQAGP